MTVLDKMSELSFPSTQEVKNAYYFLIISVVESVKDSVIPLGIIEILRITSLGVKVKKDYLALNE